MPACLPVGMSTNTSSPASVALMMACWCILRAVTRGAAGGQQACAECVLLLHTSTRSCASHAQATLLACTDAPQRARSPERLDAEVTAAQRRQLARPGEVAPRPARRSGAVSIDARGRRRGHACMGEAQAWQAQ